MRSILPSILVFLFSVTAFAQNFEAPQNLFTLYVFPSPKGIDWSSPKGLVSSTLSNSIASSPYRLKHPIGHMSVQLQCDDGYWKTTGMTSESETEELSVVFIKKLGLGTLFHSFQGKLQSDQEVIDDVVERKKRKNVAWVRFQISSEACQRLKAYLQDYQDQMLEENYGLHLRPRYKEGAGCSAFAVSFLELAGLMTEDLDADWKSERRVPEKFIGSEKQPVGIGNILWSRDGQRWADPSEKHRLISFWDPDMIYRWIRERSGSELGLNFDRREVPVPEDSIWKSE